MIKPLRLSEIASALNGKLLGGDAVFSRVCTDTRAIEAGDVFVALKGENFDGHDFVAQAAKDGAVAAIVERAVEAKSLPQLMVNDSTEVLADLAALNRRAFSGVLVALTGSCGKTTVKEMLASILSACGSTVATQGNLNNHIGAPMTVLGIPVHAEFAVIEMGASGLGEIDYLAKMARPHVSLVNNVAAAHLEGFGSEAGVAAEKSRIYHHLVEGGTAVVNGDEPYAAEWCQWLARHRPDVRLCRYAVNDSESDVWARNITLTSSGGYAFELCVGSDSVSITLPLLGKQNVNNALAAAACSLSAGASLENVRDGLHAVKPVSGRMQGYRQSDDLLIVDDSYNANPASVVAAALALVDFQGQGKQTVMILGGLAELGENANEALCQLGKDLQKTGLNNLLCVGGAAPVATSFEHDMTPGQRCRVFESKQQVIDLLAEQEWKGSVVLVKGSRSSRMEEVVNSLTTNKGEQ